MALFVLLHSLAQSTADREAWDRRWATLPSAPLRLAVMSDPSLCDVKLFVTLQDRPCATDAAWLKSYPTQRMSIILLWKSISC